MSNLIQCIAQPIESRYTQILFKQHQVVASANDLYLIISHQYKNLLYYLRLFNKHIKHNLCISIGKKDSIHCIRFLSIIAIILLLGVQSIAHEQISPNQAKSTTILGSENFTFIHNGSFIQIDAGREWPFNSKREISFRFKTKSPHGLLIYQTFDHNKLVREEDQEILDNNPLAPQPKLKTQTKQENELPQIASGQNSNDDSKTTNLRRSVNTILDDLSQIRHLNRAGRDNDAQSDPTLSKLSTSTITATASEKLVNSLFLSSPIAAINGNGQSSHNQLTTQVVGSRDKPVLSTVGATSLISSRDQGLIARNNRVLNTMAMGTEFSDSSFGKRSSSETNDGSTVLSSSTISTFSATLYELYLKLENGRLKIMYEFGSRLNQTYCGKGLNDDRWHKVELKVDPEINQMVLILDQFITVEIVLSQSQQEDETSRRNELVFTNSILYMGGLDNNASIVKNVRQRLYMAQFIGCIGQIMLKTDQHTETSNQPAAIDRVVLVKRGCVNRCETNNYCLHKSTCINHYTHTQCDCFGTKHEDVYCWNDQLTTLSMLGYSTLVYRIYDWRDRHHSSQNRLSLQFRTLTLDSILFFAYGDLSAQQTLRSSINAIQSPISTMAQTQTLFSISQVNSTSLPTVHRPVSHQFQGNSNYLAVSLSNGTIVVEVNFGDQPILLSNLLYDKISSQTVTDKNSTDPQDYKKYPNLSDGLWHNVTLIHSNKQIYLYLDNYSVAYTIIGKNQHLYFDPSIYVGSVPNFLYNETRSLIRPLNLRHKFVGCMKSVYFNQHNILFALKQNSSMAEYRDLLGRPRLDTCIVQEPSSLPLTLRSGKSYLTFQLTSNQQLAPMLSNLKLEAHNYAYLRTHSDIFTANKKLTSIVFDYKTSQKTHFLAGGHLRDLSYHDLGGFWTLHAREDCRLYFTMSSGLTFEPEQVINVSKNNISCEPRAWFRVSLSILSGDKVLNISRSRIDSHSNESHENDVATEEHGSYTLVSSVELLHQVQLGGDLAKFGESSSIPFSGCLRNIQINGHSFDSRDFVTNLASLQQTNLNQTSPISMPMLQSQIDVISNRLSQGYVTIDSCQLVNQCTVHNPCKNNGICKINELGEPDCDCSKTGYTGKRCHFSTYKQSCQDLHLAGQRKSSHYLIDLDRNGPLKPIRVRCNMEELDNGMIETTLSHNLPAEYLIRRSTITDISLDVTYMAFHHMYTSDGFYLHDDEDQNARSTQDLMLRTLIGHSLYCKQYFRYECRSAPLYLGNKTWMEVPYPKNHKLMSLDGQKYATCECYSSEKKCHNPRTRCNCDGGESIWADDSHELAKHQEVGVTKIVMLKQEPDSEPYPGSKQTQESQSRFTLSDLKCYGTKRHGSHLEITFKTSDAYIEVPGWRKGDISFSFRTASNPPAIILFQLATSRNHGYFRLTLISDTRLLFEFIVNRRPRRLYLASTHKLNNGEWQQVFIEYDPVNLRLTVNDDSTMIDLDVNDHLGTFEGPLFIGGAPSKYLVGDIYKRNGFTGCFRGLNINDKPIDLSSYLSPSMPTVISGCQPSCTKNLCQNDGKCIEYWGSYECECSNPIAHSGNNCEINLNTNSLTFVTQEAYYVQQTTDSFQYPSYLTKNVLLNVRTYQETALILYASDRYNNFLQLHKNGTSLVLTFNSNSSIVIAQVPIDDEIRSDLAVANAVPSISMTQVAIEGLQTNLPANTSSRTSTNQTSLSPTGKLQSSMVNIGRLSSIDKSIRTSNTSGSGKPIQMKIERHRLRTTFYVNNNFIVVEKPMIFLTNYSLNPWSNPELELVRPQRSKVGNKAYSRIFLANIDDTQFSTRLPGFTGCIQGFSIDNQLFDFNRAHLIGDFRGEYKIGCKMHCDSFPCKNQGTCIENWKEDKIQCKCDGTSYVGSLCDEDIAAVFNGQTSYFVYYLPKRLAPISSTPTSVEMNSEAVLINTTLPSNQSHSHIVLNDEPIESDGKLEQTESVVKFFEISLAFSTDSNHMMSARNSSGQVLVLITHANTSLHFFLAVTPDGSLLIQEDYGNSMSLSRVIKRPDQPYNDGHRHVVKYSRYNQTIQIVVDHQTYLPTMSVITANHANRFPKASLISVGTAGDRITNSEDGLSDGNFTNYSGCISNLVIKMDNNKIEPLSEAFGQNLETINVNNTAQQSRAKKAEERTVKIANTSKPSSRLTIGNDETEELDRFESQSIQSKMLNVINKLDGKEVSGAMETIVARDVEQGKCAAFKRVENVNEKRSINEPKHTPLLDPRPVYMDPPRIKPLKQRDSIVGESRPFKKAFSPIFYLSLTILIMVGLSLSIYAYYLQLRFKSERFRCDTPFFHNKRDELAPSPNKELTRE